MAILSVNKDLPDERIRLRKFDELECLAAGVSGDRALRSSVDGSSYFDALYLDGDLAGVWGYAAESLFSFRCRAWLLTTDAATPHKTFFIRQSIRSMQFLFERFEEIECCVWNEHLDAIRWLTWLGFEPCGHHKAFTFMLAKRENARWVS